jgi:lysophospholipase L1-like esterase
MPSTREGPIRKGLWLVAVAILLAVPAASSAEAAHVGYPSSIASTGDSITRAFNACPFPFVDCPRNSWSTGSSSAVNSHYLRILAANPAISGRSFNDAQTGAKMADLGNQVAAAIAQHVGYVTVLMGANDVCTSSVATMTATTTLAAQLRGALQTLSGGLPNARIFVASIPNVYRLSQILHTNFFAVLTWDIADICQSLLANPTSTAPADIARRRQVYDRTVADNAAIANVCARFVHCRFDGNAAFNVQFTTGDVSTRDYFHPSVSGQAKSAAATWAATFDFHDGVAPVSSATTAPDPNGGTDVTLSATDNAGVAGIEYAFDSASYQRYAGTIDVPAGVRLTYRAVDVNGNTETTHTLTG